MANLISLSVLFIVIAYSVYAVFRYSRMISNIFLSLVYTPSFEFNASSIGEKITILDSSAKEIETLFVENKGSSALIVDHDLLFIDYYKIAT